MTFDNYKFTIRLPSGGINSSDKTDNEWDQYIVNSTLNGAISTPGDNTVWNWQNIYSWTSTTPTTSSGKRVMRGNATVSQNSNATSTSAYGFRPVLLIESTYKIKYLFEDNGEVKKYVDSNEDLVPAMTDYTNGMITISASSEYNTNYKAWKSFNNATEIEVYDIWYTKDVAQNYSNLINEWIKIDFGEPKTVTKYTMRSRDSYSVIVASDWVVEGSNDNINWTILHTVTGQNNMAARETRTFALDTTGNYRYYRFRITGNKNERSYVGFGQLDLFGEKKWITVGNTPATKEMFLNDGMDDLYIIDNNALQQLESDTPKLLMWTDDVNKTSASARLTAVPHSQLIFQEGDIDVSAGVESLFVNSTVQNASTLKIIASADGGVTWKTFDGAEWQIITDDASQVKVNGMTPDVVNGLTKTQIDDLLQGSNTLRFAYYLEQDQLNDKINIDDITITALPTATETPTLDSIKIVYDELTIEGRMQDLEKINAINMAKLQFKSNVLLQSEKYKLHDLVVDTFESLSGIDISNTNALYDENHKEFIYDASDGAPTIQEVILQEETLSDYRKKFMLYVDQEGNIDYEYSLDSGVTWNSIIPFTMIDLTEQTGTKLKVKAKLKDSTAKLRGIAFSWI